MLSSGDMRTEKQEDLVSDNYRISCLNVIERRRSRVLYNVLDRYTS